MTEYAEVQVTMHSAEEGGRRSPIAPHCHENVLPYMPHFRVGLGGEYLGVAFVDGPELISPGESATATVALVYIDRSVDYSPLIASAAFSVMEGGRVVGHGHVLRRWQSMQDWRTYSH